MKFSAVLVAGFAALGLAKPAITNLSFNLVEGQPFTLTWIDAKGPVKVELLSGPDSGSLQPVRTLSTGESGSSLTFTPSGLPSGNYAFRVTDSDSQPNFSLLFAYTGTGSVSGSSSSGTASKTSTRSTSSAASSTAASSDTSSMTTSTASTRSTSSTSTRSTSTRSTSTNTPTGAPTNNNEGQRFSSSLALVFMTVAALVFFN